MAKRAKATKAKTKAAGLTVVPFKAAPKGPAPDSYWLVKTKKQWVDFWLFKKADEIDLALDSAAVFRIFGLYDERERCYRAYRKERVVVGSRKQPTINPLVRYGGQLDNQIRQMEKGLLMDPKSRRQAIGKAGVSIDDLNRALDEDEETEDPRK